jgi:hypothetical protein
MKHCEEALPPIWGVEKKYIHWSHASGKKMSMSIGESLKKQYACKHVCLDFFSFSHMLVSILNPQKLKYVFDQ